MNSPVLIFGIWTRQWLKIIRPNFGLLRPPIAGFEGSFTPLSAANHAFPSQWHMQRASSSASECFFALDLGILVVLKPWGSNSHHHSWNGNFKFCCAQLLFFSWSTCLLVAIITMLLPINNKSIIWCTLCVLFFVCCHQSLPPFGAHPRNPGRMWCSYSFEIHSLWAQGSRHQHRSATTSPPGQLQLQRLLKPGSVEVLCWS